MGQGCVEAPDTPCHLLLQRQEASVLNPILQADGLEVRSLLRRQLGSDRVTPHAQV